MQRDMLEKNATNTCIRSMTLALLLLLAASASADVKVATALRSRHHNGTHHHASSNASRAHVHNAVQKTADAPSSKTKVMGNAACLIFGGACIG